MIVAIVIGRSGSKGFPGKNTTEVLGRPLVSYPILAAVDCELVDKVFVSTDCDSIKSIARLWGVEIIDRPPELCTDEALGEDVFIHAFNKIIFLKEFDAVEMELLVLLFANAPCITFEMMEEMVELIRRYPGADSVCTVSPYAMFSPYRMRKIEGKWLHNWGELDCSKITCDRSSGEIPYIYDCSCAVVRPKCLVNIDQGLPPQRWLGQKILPYKQKTPALDLDYEWQLGQIEFWLTKHWYSNS